MGMQEMDVFRFRLAKNTWGFIDVSFLFAIALAALIDKYRIKSGRSK